MLEVHGRVDTLLTEFSSGWLTQCRRVLDGSGVCFASFRRPLLVNLSEVRNESVAPANTAGVYHSVEVVDFCFVFCMQCETELDGCLITSNNPWF